MAIEPAKGMNAAATITKSKTFQGSLKKRQGFGQSAISLITISATKIQSTTLSRTWSGPSAAARAAG